MKIVIQLFTALLLLTGVITLLKQTTANHRLVAEVSRLEAELGKMPIEDEKKVYVVEIEEPEVPPEVAPHVAGIWQFRCYLPPSYAFIQINASGRVAKDGLVHFGGYSSSWSTPKPTAIHGMLTVSLRKKDKSVEMFYSFGGSAGTTSWNSVNAEPLSRMFTQKLASSKHGAKAFDQQTILPVLKVLDPTTAEEKDVAGKSLTTYEGGLFVLCPKAREPDLQQLRDGKLPGDFKAEWIAAAVSDE